MLPKHPELMFIFHLVIGNWLPCPFHGVGNPFSEADGQQKAHYFIFCTKQIGIPFTGIGNQPAEARTMPLGTPYTMT